MRTYQMISTAAALLLASTMLYASPDRDDGQNDNYSQGYEHSYSHENNGRKDQKQREKASNSQSRDYYAPPPVNRSGTPPGQDKRRAAPPGLEKRPAAPYQYDPYRAREDHRENMTRTPQKSVQRENEREHAEREYSEKHRHYYRPPGARPVPYYHQPGYTVSMLPRLAITLSIGGLSLYYADGIYYRHASSGFIVSVPPVGLIVTTLPPDCTVFVRNGITYYYYADVYYVRDGYQSYRVVQPPVINSVYRPGEVVDTLPDGAYSTTINGIQYYRYGDLYFMQAIQGNRVVYIVVTP